MTIIPFRTATPAAPTAEEADIRCAFNPCQVKEPCAFCGDWDRRGHPGLFDDGGDRVCLECARTRVPKLAEVFEWYWREVDFAFDERSDTPIIWDVVSEMELELIDGRTLNDFSLIATEADTSRLEAMAHEIAHRRHTCGCRADVVHERLPMDDDQPPPWN